MSDYAIYKIETFDRITKEKYVNQYWSFDTLQNMRKRYLDLLESPNLVVKIIQIPNCYECMVCLKLYISEETQTYIISNFTIKSLVKRLLMLDPKVKYLIQILDQNGLILSNKHQ
jgi:hypothetical protein